MKTYLIPSVYRHSVIEFFDSLVQEGSVAAFFVGDVNQESNHFQLIFEVADGYKEIAFPQFKPTYASLQLNVVPVEKNKQTALLMLRQALHKIATNNSVWQLEEAKKILEEFITIDLSLVDFEDDGRFQVAAFLEWLS